MIGWQFDDREELFRQIKLLLGYMNGLYDYFGIGGIASATGSVADFQRAFGASMNPLG